MFIIGITEYIFFCFIALHHGLTSPPPQNLSLPSRSPHPMNPPPLGNNNNNLSRSGTPNMKTGGGMMQNARAQQNHTPNQPLMHGTMGSGNSDSMPNSMSNQGMYGGGGGGGNMPPHSLQSGFPSSYSNYDVGTGQMSYGVTSMNNSIHSQSMSHSQPMLQR